MVPPSHRDEEHLARLEHEVYDVGIGEPGKAHQVRILAIDLAENGFAIIHILPLGSRNQAAALSPGHLRHQDIACVVMQRRDRTRGSEPEVCHAAGLGFGEVFREGTEVLEQRLGSGTLEETIVGHQIVIVRWTAVKYKVDVTGEIHLGAMRGTIDLIPGVAVAACHHLDQLLARHPFEVVRRPCGKCPPGRHQAGENHGAIGRVVAVAKFLPGYSRSLLNHCVCRIELRQFPQHVEQCSALSETLPGAQDPVEERIGVDSSEFFGCKFTRISIFRHDFQNGLIGRAQELALSGPLLPPDGHRFRGLLNRAGFCRIDRCRRNAFLGVAIQPFLVAMVGLTPQAGRRHRGR